MSLNNNSKTYALSLHTSSPQLGLSISNFSNELRSQTWDLDRQLSNCLHQCILDFLSPQTWQDLGFIAVARGPGSFTSSRIGIVTARTLAQQLEIPLFTVSSLAAFAWSQKEIFASTDLLAVEMEATRGQLYGAIYQLGSETISNFIYMPDELLKPEIWQQKLTKIPTSYQCLSVPKYLGNTANNLLEIAYKNWQEERRPHWSEALPFYG